MYNHILILAFLFLSTFVFSQKEVTATAELKKVTVFFTGAQIQHEDKLALTHIAGYFVNLS
jgi:hypothetical protein